MGMRYEDSWYNYDLSELFNAIGGYYDAENRRTQESWEQTRLILSSIENKPVHGYKIKHRVANKILPLPWDESVDVPDDEKLIQLRKETWELAQ